MSIENTFERIAVALERLAAAVEQGVAPAVTVGQMVREVTKADQVIVDDAAAKAAAEQAIAEAKAAEKAAAAKAAAEKAAAEKKAAEKKAAEKKAADEAAAAAALADKPKASSVTKDDVRKALQGYREIEGTPAMLEVLKAYGATNLNDLGEDKYEAVIEKVKG